MGSFTIEIVYLLCIFGFSLQASGSLTLTMTPAHYLHINRLNTPEVNISCVLRDEAGQPVALAGCQYREYYNTNYTMQFNEGPASRKYTSSSGWIGKYQGRGLEHGECGLTVGGYGKAFDSILGCRLKPLTGRWQTAAMLLSVTCCTPIMQYHLEPPGVRVALAGTEVSIKGTAEHVLAWCMFTLPPADNTEGLFFPTDTNYSQGRYHGAGLDEKECGATLQDVRTSGFVRGDIRSMSPVSYSEDFVELIVMSAPESPPLLTVLTPGVLHPGYILEATCLVKNSRPAANITWYVGDEEVRSRITEDGVMDSTWRWNHDPQTVQTRLRLRVDSSHHGKRLLCRAGHLALPSGYQNSSSYDLQVIVLDPCTPNPCRGEHTVCFAEGQGAVCRCQDPYIDYPPSCRLECAKDTDCSQYRTCIASHCVDVCLPGTCGKDAECSVKRRAAVCKCPAGFIGDPHVRCVEENDANCGTWHRSLVLAKGGQDADRGQFPWHAALYGRLTDGSFLYFCGGTLIKPNVVVTAAHCVYIEQSLTVQNASVLKVGLGKLDREYNGDPANSGVQTSDVDKVMVYPRYRGNKFYQLYDIALLKLTSPVHMTSAVNVACMEWGVSSHEDEEHNMAGVEGRVAGWGVNNDYTTGSRRLQWIDLPWIDQDSCINQTMFRAQHLITNDKFCAGFVNKTKSVCRGDSGGGYMVLKNGRYYLRGVVSTSLSYTDDDRVCSAEHYTTFTSLSEYTSWVKRNV